jgi:SAM-dependent methyltransferase
LLQRFLLSSEDLVIEIGSNDGVLLGHIQDRVRVLGIDPSHEAAQIAQEERGVDTIVSFLDDAAVETVLRERGQARLIIANNVMAHIDDIVGAFERVRRLLVPGGTFVFEVHWVGNLIGEGGFDQIYHEHLCYFSLHALQYLIKKAHMQLVDAEFVPIHGTSLRVYATNGDGELSERGRNILKTEQERALHEYSAYADFARRVETIKRELLALLEKLHAAGKNIVGYGAPAKGNTLLNYCSIDSRYLLYVTDSTLLKQGKYTPGTHLKVERPEKLQEDIPDYALLLAWNYKDAILAKEKNLGDKGLKFIVAIPTVEIV